VRAGAITARGRTDLQAALLPFINCQNGSRACALTVRTENHATEWWPYGSFRCYYTYGWDTIRWWPYGSCGWTTLMGVLLMVGVCNLAGPPKVNAFWARFTRATVYSIRG
jgi:hypothetical protein